MHFLQLSIVQIELNFFYNVQASFQLRVKHIYIGILLIFLIISDNSRYFNCGMFTRIEIWLNIGKLSDISTLISIGKFQISISEIIADIDICRTLGNKVI